MTPAEAHLICELRQALPPLHDCAVLHEEHAAAFELRAWPAPLFDVDQVRRVSISYQKAQHQPERMLAISRLVVALSRPLNSEDKRFAEQSNTP